MITIIIPIFNEEEALRAESSKFNALSQDSELIFVDGGSTDKSIEMASKLGKVFTSNKGRAAQMNFGSEKAQNNILLFLHADNIISPNTLQHIQQLLNGNKVVGGCLTQRIDNNRFIYRLIEAQGNIRAKMSKIFYGDQGIFVKNDIFVMIDGFPEVPIFEDVLFTRKLRNAGETTVLPDKILVSARRWEKRGVIQTIFMFISLLIMFHLGFPLEKIKAYYEDLR